MPRVHLLDVLDGAAEAAEAAAVSLKAVAHSAARPSPGQGDGGGGDRGRAPCGGVALDAAVLLGGAAEAAEAAAVPLKAARRTVPRVHLLDVLDGAAEAAEAAAVPLQAVANRAVAHSAARPSPGRGDGGGGGRGRAPCSGAARGAAVQLLDGAAAAAEAACPSRRRGARCRAFISWTGRRRWRRPRPAPRGDASCGAPVHLLDAGA